MAKQKRTAIRPGTGVGTQAKNGDVVVQLATRIPKDLYREIKLYAVTDNVSISELVTEAMQDLLVKRGARKKPKQKEAVNE